MKTHLLRYMWIGLLIGLHLSNADAKSYVGTQRDIKFSSDDLMTLVNAEGVELNGPEDLSKYLFDTPIQKLLQQAESQGLSPEIMESTLSIGEEKLRFDTTVSMMGKMSYLMRLDEEKLYSILWDRKQYIEMTFEEIEQMRAKTQQMRSQLLDRLPPEARARLDSLPPEIRERMKAQMGGQPAPESQPVHVKKTGRKKTINGFLCEEYRIEGKSKQQIWISSKYPSLRKSLEAVLTQLPSFDKSDKKDDKREIWKQIETGWPVVIKKFKSDPRRMRQMSFDIQEMVSMEEKSLPSDTFTVPDDFERKTMQQMMQGMMPAGQLQRPGLGR